MASWNEIETAEPEFAAAVRAFMDAGRHKTLATLRVDGAPRISGTEAAFVDGDLWWGSMPNARKAVDLQRDPRFALHSASVDPPAWTGDAKISGRAIEVHDQAAFDALVRAQGHEPEAIGDGHLFRADVTEVALVRLSDAKDRLIIESWAEGRTPSGLRRTER